MKFCKNCGTQMETGVRFCPGCGIEVEGVNTSQEQANHQGYRPDQQQATTQTINSQSTTFEEKIANINNTKDSTADFDSADVEQNKAMGILAYLSWLVLIPIFAAPNSKYVRFHANQGLVLAITEIVWIIAQVILSTVLFAISWCLGFISTLLSLVNILFLVLAIIGIINAVNGRAKELPIIGKFKILK